MAFRHSRLSSLNASSSPSLAFTPASFPTLSVFLSNSLFFFLCFVFEAREKDFYAAVIPASNGTPSGI